MREMKYDWPSLAAQLEAYPRDSNTYVPLLIITTTYDRGLNARNFMRGTMLQNGIRLGELDDVWITPNDLPHFSGLVKLSLEREYYVIIDYSREAVTASIVLTLKTLFEWADILYPVSYYSTNRFTMVTNEGIYDSLYNSYALDSLYNIRRIRSLSETHIPNLPYLKVEKRFAFSEIESIRRVGTVDDVSYFRLVSKGLREAPEDTDAGIDLSAELDQ